MKARLVGILAALFLAPLSAQVDVAADEGSDEPAEPWLRLDYIVFEHVRPQPVYLDEAWRFRKEPDTLAVDSHDPRALALLGIRILPESGHALAEQARTLDRRSRYRILKMQSLALPPLPRDQATPIRIHDGMELALTEPQIVEFESLGWGAEYGDGFSFAQPPSLTDRLDGTAQVFRERYLHMAFKLRLIEPIAGLASPTIDMDGRLEYDINSVQSYKINAARRVKTDEVHYFDHGQFGILARLDWIEQADLPPLPEIDELPVDSQAQPSGSQQGVGRWAP